MTRVEQLEYQIAELNPEELKALRTWFARHDAGAWDRQIESDSRNGKLHRLVDDALAHDRTGRTNDL